MTRDPMAPATAAFTDAAAQLRRDLDQTRQGWNDEARRKFDAAFANRIVDEANATVRALIEVREELRQAMTELG